MPQPDRLTETDLHLVHYLLGLLPEKETDCLDEASIVDDDVAARLARVEDDLVDAYVMETLDPSMRDRFEASYLKTPRRRTKVHFSRRFLAAVDRVSDQCDPIHVAGSDSDRARRVADERRWRISWPVATAAASFLLACGLLVNDLQLRQRLNQADQRGAAEDRRKELLSRQLDEARGENAQINEALERSRAASPPPASASEASPRRAAVGATTAIVLLPQTRSIGQPPRINIPINGGDIHFQLNLESNDFTQYRASLNDPVSNQRLWRSAILSSQSNGSIVVSVAVPSDLFKSQHYSFELAGVDQTGTETPVSGYAFQVDRR